MNKWFSKFASKASEITGSSWAFLAAVAIIVVWAITGPLFNFSDTWQLIINTFTTLVTFLMVFLIQNTQNRDAKALHLKLDEVIHVLGAAHNELIDVEDRSDEELRELIKVYRTLARRKHQPGDKEQLLEEVLARQDTGLGTELKAEEKAHDQAVDQAVEVGAALREAKSRA